MPRYDGTGPVGMGPGTGGGRGFCQPETQTTAKKEPGPLYGAGRGGIPCGGGRGRVWGGRRSVEFNVGNRGFNGSGRMRSGQETEYLKNRAAEIERELKRIQKRISRIEANE